MQNQSKALKWAGVELRHLQTLAAIAEHGSMARAARVLGYSQPAVSQQLAVLERLVGVRLFDRGAGRRRVTVTEAGRIVLGHGATIVARARAAETDLAALTAGAGLPIRLATIPSVGARVVPTLLRRFADAFPDVPVHLRQDDSNERLAAAVEQGESDLAFLVLPAPPGPFATTELLRDPYCLFAGAESRLAQRGSPVEADELVDLPLMTCSQSAAAERHLRARGLDVRIDQRVDDNETLAGLVGAGLGTALVPRLTIDPLRPDVVAVPLAVPLPPRVIGAIRHRDRHLPPSVDALVDLAQRTYAQA